MSYYDVLSDRSAVLSQLMTGSGKKIHVTGFTLLNDMINERLAIAIRSGGTDPQASSPLLSQMSDAVVQGLGADVLARIQNVTFNDAVPIVKDIIEKMRQVINPDIPIAYTTCEVKPVIYDPIWDSQFIMDLTSRGRNLPLNSINTNGMIKDLSEEQYQDLGKLALSGVDSVDEMMATVLGRMDTESLGRLFADTFQHGWLPSQNATDLLFNEQSKNHWIIIYFWCRSLENLPPKSSALSLANFKANLLLLEEKACNIIAAVEDLRQVQSESEALVLNVERSAVYVNNDLYIDYLSEESKGTVDAILGTSLMLAETNRRQYTKAQVLEGKADLELAWSRHVSASTVAHSQKMATVARRQLQLILDGIAADRVANEKMDRASLDLVLDRNAAITNALEEGFLGDLNKHIFEIVAKVFYPDSDVGKMLNCLREVGEAKEEEARKNKTTVCNEEVRVLAVINFMGDWLADTIVLL